MTNLARPGGSEQPRAVPDEPRPARPATALPVPLVLGVLALAVILFRAGGLWTELIDWDEWSFILMGADVAQGHLPFVHQFDLKPPLIFFLFGATIALFGKSLLAIRLLGALCVFATAWFVYLVSRRIVPPLAALAGALLFVAIASAKFGLATSSELPAIVFLSVAAWRLIRRPLRRRDAAMAGLLVSLAVLTRTNLAVVALAVGLLLCAGAWWRSAKLPRLAWLAYGTAGLLPPLALVLVYALAGELETLRIAMIDVPLAYSGQLGPGEVAWQHAAYLHYSTAEAPLLFIPLLLLALVGAVAACVRLARREDDGMHTWPLAVLLVTATAVGASLLLGGAAYPHYWLQILPFAGCLAAIGAAEIARAARPGVYGAGALVLLPLASAGATSLAAAPASYADPHSALQAARFIRSQGGPGARVWALHYHIINWYLDAPVLSPAGVHPDNLTRTAVIKTLATNGYVGPNEVGRIMESRPDYVILDDKGFGRAWVRKSGEDFDGWLAANYRRAAQFGAVIVYRRR